MTHKRSARMLLLAASLMGLAAASRAADEADGADDGDERGHHLVQIGAFAINTLDSSHPLQTQLSPGLSQALGVQGRFESPGTRATVSGSRTLALVYSYLIGDHLLIKFEGGVPAEFKLTGSGNVQPTGALGALFNVDLGAPANNPLAKVTQWSPVIALQYFFRDPSQRLRPYLGVGATYTWFTNVRVNQNFQDQLNQKFGSTLAVSNLKPGATRVAGWASDDFAPVFNGGITADLGAHWSLSASLSYVLLKTDAHITVDAADGSRLATSQTRIDLDPLVAALLLGYRFSL